MLSAMRSFIEPPGFCTDVIGGMGDRRVQGREGDGLHLHLELHEYSGLAFRPWDLVELHHGSRANHLADVLRIGRKRAAKGCGRSLVSSERGVAGKQTAEHGRIAVKYA